MELFENNIFAIYLIACVAIFCYTNFKEKQRMFLIYIFTYAACFAKIFSVVTGFLLLIAVTFVFLEYLSEDSKKLVLFTKLKYKIQDYLFMMLFQYHFLWIIGAYLMLYIETTASFIPHINPLLKIYSLIFLFCGIHFSISQPFKIKTITEISETFDAFPPYKFNYKEEMQEKFDMVCCFEDETYFERSKSYSSFSLEYIKLYLRKFDYKSKHFYKKAYSKIKPTLSIRNLKLKSRGHSTPEMQLLRTIAVARGFEEHPFKRKIFEIVYSKIFFSALKEYHESNTYLDMDNYRHYLLYIYLNTVMTKIDGIRYTPFSSAFKDNKIENWSMEGLFAACLGLSFREASDYQLELFGHIIERFELDPNLIKRLYYNFPQKLPSKTKIKTIKKVK